MINRAGARRYWPIWLAVVPLALWALVRVFGLERGSFVTTAMFFTPYAAIGALMVVGVAIAWRNWAATAVGAIAAACLMAAVLPRAIGSEAASPAGRETLSVLSANVYLGDADPEALVALVDRFRPDVLSVQELTPSFVRRLRAAGIEKRLPHAVLMAQPKGRGGGLFARSPLSPLPYRTHFFFRMPRALLRLPDGRRVRLVAVHPQPPPMSMARWKEALASLPRPGTGSPWVLVGDFNSTFDQAEFRDLVDSGYRDAGEATGQGLEPTWPGPGEGLWSMITIDHVLADDRLGVAEYGVEDLAGSDHRAVHAELVLPWD
jgi:endonuclease/exonuclease/phosphatase (EEP) superfamily protein YafD